MPPHRKNRWILATIFAPLFMAGFAYAYNMKTENKWTRLINAGIIAIGLQFGIILIFSFPAGLSTPYEWFDKIVGYTVFLVFPALWIIPALIVRSYWNKLPVELKQLGW